MSLLPHGQRLAADWLGYAYRVAEGIGRRWGRDPIEMRSLAHLALVESAARFNPNRSEPESFFRFSIKQTIIAHLRSGQTSRQSSRHAAGAPLPFDVGDRGEWCDEADRRDEVETLLALVPGRDLGIIRDHFFGGLTHEEIAAPLGVTASTISKRILYALSVARKAYQEPPHRRCRAVEHPGWPGYGLDPDGVVWSFRQGEPRPRKPTLKPPSPRPYLELRMDVGRRTVSLEHFTRTHPNCREWLGIEPLADLPVEHPDWPGYGLDRGGTVWTYRQGEPKPLKAALDSRGGRAPSFCLRINKTKRKVSYEQFVATHPLNRHEAERKAS